MIRSRVLLAASFSLLLNANIAAAETLAVPKVASYAKGAQIRSEIRNECGLEKKLADFIREYGGQQFSKVVSTSKAPGGAKKLTVHITEVQGRPGGAWSGGKSVRIKGSLSQNGKTVGTFEGMRVSGGGVFGGYKGTCSILGRCVKALGKDVATWAANPSQNARLGDL